MNQYLSFIKRKKEKNVKQRGADCMITIGFQNLFKKNTSKQKFIKVKKHFCFCQDESIKKENNIVANYNSSILIILHRPNLCV